MPRHDQDPLKRRALTALHDLAEERFGRGFNVAEFRFLGQGISRKTWSAVITGPGGIEHDWVAQVPRLDLDDTAIDRFGREFELLGRLASHELPFRTPQPVAQVEVEGSPVNVTTFCYGAPIGMRDRLLRPDQAATITAEVAAAVHAIPPAGMPSPGASR